MFHTFRRFWLLLFRFVPIESLSVCINKRYRDMPLTLSFPICIRSFSFLSTSVVIGIFSSSKSPETVNAQTEKWDDVDNKWSFSRLSLSFFNREVRHVGRRSFLIRSKLEELPRRNHHVLRTSANSSRVTAGSGNRKWSLHRWKRLHGWCTDLSAKRSTTACERIPTEEQSVSKCFSISSKYALLLRASWPRDRIF